MASDDLVETETPVFTEEDVYMLGGFLADRWDVMRTTDEVVGDIEEAVMDVLNFGR